MSVKVSVLPVAVEVDGAVVYIVELLKSRMPDGNTWYHAICILEWNGIRTRSFVVSFRSEGELREKLRTEVARLKLMTFLLGPSLTSEVVTR